MVTFSEYLENGIANMEFGYRGGPFEANLRDILRWCNLLQSGFEKCVKSEEDITLQEKALKNFQLVLFEKMKLVYCQRMRMDQDKDYILKAFSEIFNCDAFALDKKSQNIGLYWNDETVYLSDIVYHQKTDDTSSCFASNQQHSPILLKSQYEMLKNITECVKMKKPLILCGPNDCGKTKVKFILYVFE